MKIDIMVFSCDSWNGPMFSM